MKTPKHNPLAKEMATADGRYRPRVTRAKRGRGSYNRAAARQEKE